MENRAFRPLRTPFTRAAIALGVVLCWSFGAQAGEQETDVFLDAPLPLAAVAPTTSHGALVPDMDAVAMTDLPTSSSVENNPAVTQAEKKQPLITSPKAVIVTRRYDAKRPVGRVGSLEEKWQASAEAALPSQPMTASQPATGYLALPEKRYEMAALTPAAGEAAAMPAANAEEKKVDSIAAAVAIPSPVPAPAAAVPTPTPAPAPASPVGYLSLPPTAENAAPTRRTLEAVKTEKETKPLLTLDAALAPAPAAPAPAVPETPAVTTPPPVLTPAEQAAAAAPPTAEAAAPPAKPKRKTKRKKEPETVTPMPVEVPVPLMPSAVALLDDTGANPGNVLALSPESQHILNTLPAAPPPKQKKAKQAPVKLEHEQQPTDLFADKPYNDISAVGVTIQVKRQNVSTALELEKAYQALMGGQRDEAIRIYQSILEHEPNNNHALFGLATTYHRVGQLSLARPLYGKLLANNPNYPEGLNNFLALVAEEAPEDALAQLQNLALRNPNFSPIPAQMAIICEKLGRGEEAVAHMKQAVRLSPENMTYVYNLAVLYDRLGKRGEAAEVYQKLIAASDRGEPLPGARKAIQERLIFLRSNRG